MSYHHAQHQARPTIRRKRRHHGDDTTATTPTTSNATLQHVLHLQRTIGNKATQSLLQRSPELMQGAPPSIMQRAATEATEEESAFKGAWNGALADYKAGKYISAINALRYIEETMDIDAGIRAKLYYSIGVCHMKLDEPTNALDYFEKSMEVQGTSRKIFSMALEMAVTARDAIAKKHPPKYFGDLGVAHYEAGNFQQALDIFSRGLMIYKTIDPVLKIKFVMNIAVCMFRLGRYKDAKEKVLEAFTMEGMPADIQARGQDILKRIAKKMGGSRAGGKSGGKKKPFIF